MSTWSSLLKTTHILPFADINQFVNNGFFITSPLIDSETCASLDLLLTQLLLEGVGTRQLLDLSWCSELAKNIRQHPAISPFLSPDAVAVQCTFFEKSKEQNWLVSFHQDLSIPVNERVDHIDLSGWSEKEGTLFVQAPLDILQKMYVVRLHIDECTAIDGPLKVIPATHQMGRLSCQAALEQRELSDEVICVVKKGAALLMNPLLLHASSKASGQSKRRMLHFVFGPPVLSHGLRSWQKTE